MTQVSRAQAPDPLPDDCMPSSEVRIGMVGEGRTVFQGYKPEPFKAHILGVQRNPMAQGNMIIARLEGKFLEQHGVVAGMSGSPVFVDGKIIGAVAYGWLFAYAPYCGITPIEQMWTVWQAIDQPTLTEQGQEAAGRQRRDKAWDWRGDWQAYQRRLDGEADPHQMTTGFRPDLPELKDIPGEMKPLWAPVFLSSASPRTEKRLRNFFAGMGIEMMGAGSLGGAPLAADGGASDEPAPPIEHGSALGVPILSGDLSLSSVGTVTYRRGDKLIAFGHPMFGQGGIRAPMAQAYIFGFMQAYSRSFKMGEVREVIGTIDQDRLYAIGGKFGAGPPRVPISISIKGSAAFRPRDYHFSCWKNERFIPMMTGAAFEESYISSVADGGKLTGTTDYRIRLADGRTIEKHFLSSSEGFVIGEAGFSMLFDLFALLDNPYREADIASIEITSQIEPGYRADEMIAMEPRRSSYLAGERVGLRGRFRTWRGEEFSRDFSLDLPANLRPGAYVIHATDASGSQRVRLANQPGLFEPRDFDGVVRMLQASAPATDELSLWLFEPAVNVTVRGQELQGIPTSIATLVGGTTPPDAQNRAVGRLVASASQRLAAPMLGGATLLINVVDKLNE